MDILGITDEEYEEEKKAFEKWMKENAHKYKTEEELSRAIRKFGFLRGWQLAGKRHKKKRGVDN